MTKFALPHAALVALAAAGLGLAGCDSAKENAAEDTADEVRTAAEATADAIENQAEGGAGDEMAPAGTATSGVGMGAATPMATGAATGAAGTATATATATATP